MYRRDDFSDCTNSYLLGQRALYILMLAISILGQKVYAEMPSESTQVPQTGLEQMETLPDKSASNKSNTFYDVAPFVAEYKVDTDALPLSGTGVRSLKHLGGGKYRMEQVAKSFLLTRREISEFSMNNCRLTPESYRYEQSGIGRDRRHLLDFHAKENRVTYEANKNKTEINLPEETAFYDRLSETLALQCQLLKHKANNGPNNKPITLHVVDKGQLREHTFAVVAEETLQVAKTEMQTIKVQRVREGGDRETTLWFAPRQSYALVKMKQVNKGKTITFELKSIKQVF